MRLTFSCSRCWRSAARSPSSPEGPLRSRRATTRARLAHGGARAQLRAARAARAQRRRAAARCCSPSTAAAATRPGFQRYAGLDPLADRDGWLVAYPNGTNRLFDERLLTWNAGGCCGFAAGRRRGRRRLRARRDRRRRARSRRVDRARVYATGHSNGAMMAYRLAAEDRRTAGGDRARRRRDDGRRASRRAAPCPCCTSTASTTRARSTPAASPKTLGREIRHRAVEARARALARARRLPAPSPAERDRREPARRPAAPSTPRRCSSWAPCAERQRGAALEAHRRRPRLAGRRPGAARARDGPAHRRDLRRRGDLGVPGTFPSGPVKLDGHELRDAALLHRHAVERRRRPRSCACCA